MRELVIAHTGGTPSTGNISFWEGDIPWVSPKDFGDFYIQDSQDHLSKEAINHSGLQIFPKETVLVVFRSGILKHTLPVTIIQTPCTVNQDVKALVPKRGVKLVPEFLAYYLATTGQKLLPLITKHSTTVQSINTDQFENLMVPLPDIETQLSLAKELSIAHGAYKNKLSEAATLLRLVGDTLLQKLSISPQQTKKQLCFAMHRGALKGRLDPGFFLNSDELIVKGCQVVSLGSLTNVEPDYGSGARGVPMRSAEELKYIRITDFGQDGIHSDHEFVTAETIDRTCMLDEGDILFARSGATAGKTFLFTSDLNPAIFAGYCIRFRLNKDLVLPEFAYFFTKTTVYERWVRSIQRPSGQPNINKEEFKSLEIPLPPLSTQRAIVAEIEAIRKARREKLADATAQWQASKDRFEKHLLGVTGNVSLTVLSKPAFELVAFERANPFETHLPVYSLEAAAGKFSGSQDVKEKGWVEVKGRKLDKQMFVAQAVGKSMEPRIPDGSYCIFRAKPVGSRQNKIVLAQYRGPADPDTGGQYTVKQYRSKKIHDPDETWKHEEIRLVPLNPSYEPIVLFPKDEEDVQILAEFLDVLKPDRKKLTDEAS